jgi:hypothetical protein
MRPLSLPVRLTEPFVSVGQVVLTTMLDLTVYLVGPTEAELDWLCDWYLNLCPPEHRVAFKIDELMAWSSLSQPALTQRGRHATVQGVCRPYLEASRARIREGRAFEVQFWDRRQIADRDSWSFRCTRIKRRTSGMYGFVRMLVPLTTDPEILRQAASEIAGRVAFYSGHGGLTFAYDPWQKEAALNEAYVRARRYWAVDVEDLNASILLIRKHIKAVGWITMVGDRLAAEVESRIASLGGDIAVTRAAGGYVIIAGGQPIAGDRHLQEDSLDRYFRIAQALEPLFPEHHPDFGCERFEQPGSTSAWVRRFVEPGEW